MKKVLMTGAALVAMAATPAMAEGLKLDVAGHFKGYGVYTDADANNTREMNFRKETEIHFTGETTLDSGLTVGVHVETEMDADDDANTVEESYMYLSGGWGRVNFGEEDGAAYLLQVAAPSADSNVDGLRQYISASAENRLDYDMGETGTSSKLTYMTPVFSGFQAGVSYVPTVSDSANGTTPSATDNDAADYDDAWELAARYEGSFEGVGLALGAGYGDYSAENTTSGQEDIDAWNIGADLDFAGFGFGVVYTETTEDLATEAELETLVLGADYQMGAYKLGATYLDQDGNGTFTNTRNNDELQRYTGGVSYAYGPGMSFRGSVSYIDNDTDDTDETQVLLGTQVNF